MPAGYIMISFVTQIIVLLLASYLLLSKSDIKKYLEVVSYYLIIAGLVDTIGVLLAINGYSNMIVYRIFNLTEFILLAYMCFLIESELGYKIVILISSVTIFLYSLGGNLRAENNALPALFMALPHLALFAYSLRALYFTIISKVNPIKEGQFWLTLGFSFYFAISCVSLLLWQADFLLIGTSISISANIIKNIILIWSYRCYLKQPLLVL